MRSGNTTYNSSAFHRALAKLTLLRPGQSALDVGCGRGRTLGALLELTAPNGRTIGLDVSPEQLALAKEAHLAEVSSGRLCLVRHDATEPLPFEDGSFDAVVCQNMVECIPEKTLFLRQCHRVLRPGGVMVLGHHDFDTVMLVSGDRELTQRLVHDYAEAQLPGMASADAQMGRQLPGLMRGMPFRELETVATLDVDFNLDGDGSVVDLLQSLYDAAPPGSDPERLRRWRQDLDRRVSDGDFYCAVPWICVIGVK
jgi:ubiquinone/menaquinone biosynthesis C-methylase UbiE